ncbi:MAG: MarR family transcriptional regulator [Paenibacillus macerans]|uniref:MarR family protein n=1 Tax=Paenibacillus macerans TaxID=44252 RepID=A0A090Y6W2_PAEMA|nr:MarR family transcriptional regulator [Paenibacillus macerans]KFM94199.1 marR family protein [Paenibacillus macerans]MBS5910967.1 MarR family transcriptional regulator [Paenibacillus macerans]MCY7558710.1 MarR family transcriptional regulator [Paenibacillus macerans]MDU7473179.1 MarR family transcriptional regulator [Paenibacillus macerans]MEC0139830.1 MarR family transcriptional regulator [Paenibacillus macerans]
MSSDNYRPWPNLTPLQQEIVLELRENGTRAVMLHQTISEKIGLNATDHKCLDYLLKAGPVTAGRLAELTGLTTGAVTSVIDRLEQAGFATRDKDPNDRRKVLVKAVSEKSELISSLFDSALKATQELVTRYNEQESRIILDFLKQCNAMTLEEMDKLKQNSL